MNDMDHIIDAQSALFIWFHGDPFSIVSDAPLFPRLLLISYRTFSSLSLFGISGFLCTKSKWLRSQRLWEF